MKAYLFGWNPVKWAWDNIDEDIQKLSAAGGLEETWSVASHKTIQPGDRAYIVRLGLEPKGIFASGIVSSAPFLALRNGRTYYRVVITLDVFAEPRQTAYTHSRYTKNRQPCYPNLDTTGIRHIYQTGTC